MLTNPGVVHSPHRHPDRDLALQLWSEHPSHVDVYDVCMARLNVWVPDELAAQARARGLNVSALTQAALQVELERHATDHWLDHLQMPAATDTASAGPRVGHASVLTALDGARGEFEPAPRDEATEGPDVGGTGR